jgi:hypothetical protein
LFLAAGALLCIAAFAQRDADAGVMVAATLQSSEDAGLISRGHIEVRDLPTARPQDVAQYGPKVRRMARPASNGPPPAANATDDSVAGTAPVVTSHQIDGIDSGDINDAFDFDLTPPDTQVAVGEEHIFEMVNSLGRIFDKDGAELSSFPLTEFFGTPQGYRDADPRVLYDAAAERWFASYMAYDDSLISTDRGELEFAVSDSSNPMGGWETYFTEFEETFPDYPSLGITDDKVTASFNLYDIDAPPGPAAAGCSAKDGFCGAQTVVLQKSDLLAAADVVTTAELDVEADRYSVRAARSLSSVNDQYLASWSTAAANQIVIIRVTGTPDEGNVTEASVDALTALSQDAPPRSKTAGTGNCIITENGEDQTFPPPPCIDSGDGGMLDATWRDDLLWTSATAACTPTGDSTVRACAHLVAIDTDGTPSIEQDIMFGSAGDYYSWPAVTTDAENNVFVSLTRTRASIFAEARGTGRLADDPPNTMSGSVLLRAGDVEHNSGRWGDYMGAATDPEDTGCVWLAGEYAKISGGSSWGTYIAALSYDDSCGAPAPSPTPTATATVPSPTATVPDETNTPTNTPPPGSTPTHTRPPGSTPTRTHTPTNTPPPGALLGDVNCDGRVNSLDALAVLQFSAGLLEEVVCPANADVNDDGVINTLDAALILQFSAGLIDEF